MARLLKAARNYALKVIQPIRNNKEMFGHKENPKVNNSVGCTQTKKSAVKVFLCRAANKKKR